MLAPIRSSVTSYAMSLRDRLFLMLYPIIRPVIGKNRRNSKVRYRCLQRNLFEAREGNNLKIHFYSIHRARLYFTPAGISGRIEVVSRKYQDAKCRINPGDVVFDIGANVGEFSISAAKIASKVFSFEPDPIVGQALAANASHFGSFRFLPWAMSDKSGNLDFYLSSDDADSSAITPSSFTRKISVRCETIKSCIAEFDLSEVGFVKLEAEGYEPEILMGAGDDLLRVRKIAVDVSPERNGQSPIADVLEILNKFGFRTWCRGSVVFGVRESSDSNVG